MVWAFLDEHRKPFLFSAIFIVILQDILAFSICFATLPENELDTKGRHINKHVAWQAQQGVKEYVDLLISEGYEFYSCDVYEISSVNCVSRYHVTVIKYSSSILWKCYSLLKLSSKIPVILE